MSEPLYRIWSISKQHFVTSNNDFYVDKEGEVKHPAFNPKPDNYIIQRCTGEKDVNGKYIYQGDIVEYDIRKRFEEGRKRGVVEYLMSRLFVRQLNNGNNYDIDRFSKYTIIGNNLENPELLLEKDETDETNEMNNQLLGRERNRERDKELKGKFTEYTDIYDKPICYGDMVCIEFGTYAFGTYENEDIFKIDENTVKRLKFAERIYRLD